VNFIKKLVGWGAISDTEQRPMAIDGTTRARTMIGHEHHEIHSGRAFTCTFENTCTNATEQSVIAFNTPSSVRWIHFIASAACTSIARFSIVRNPSIDVNEGTRLNIYNKNENSSNLSIVESIENPRVANHATSFNEAQAAAANITETERIASIVIGSAGVGQTGGVGGNASHQFEWILRANRQYAFIVESLDNADNIHTLELNWYEHINKD